MQFREAVLLCIAQEVYREKVIIFFKTKKQCHRMAIFFGLLDLNACELHGIFLIQATCLKPKERALLTRSDKERISFYQPLTLQHEAWTSQIFKQLSTLSCLSRYSAIFTESAGLPGPAKKASPSPYAMKTKGSYNLLYNYGRNVCILNQDFEMFINSKKLKSIIKKTGDKVVKKTLKEKVTKKYLHQISSLEQDYDEVI